LNLQNSTGKKNALKFGISKAKEDLIILTDADCRVGENWLKSINDFYQNTKPVMIIAPLVYLSDNKLFTIKNFLVLESYSHIGMTAGFAGMKNPIMCNGANLIFEKKIFYELEDPFCDKYISGDDMFFMLNVKKKYRKKILYLNNLEAVVETDIKENLKDFFLQRIRWASKAGGYKDFSVNFTGIVILLMNYSIFGLFLALFFKIIFLKYFLILFFSKFFIDFLLITKVAIKYKNFKLLIFYLPLQLIYFFYVFWVSFFSQIKKINWKKM
jgi:cellulose synthase/poly-beta-1,6-N-acetylglucosamine synthase-like glycosyltransferase